MTTDQKLEEVIDDLLVDAIIDRYKPVILNEDDLKRKALTELKAIIREERVEELERLPFNHQTHAFSWHDIQDRIKTLKEEQ